MKQQRPIVAIFDSKSYDRHFFLQSPAASDLELHFYDFRLEPETASSCKGANTACVFVNDQASRQSLEALSKCGVHHLGLRCAGFNNVDLEAAKELKIALTRVPSYSPHAVAEHTVALLLSLNRKIHRAYNRTRELNFSLGGLVGFDLFGKTAGIVGTGKTGRLVAEILRGFKMRVLACDLHPNTKWAGKNSVEYTDMQTLARESDIISLHAPLTPQTDRIIDQEMLALMKPGVFLINVSRGRLIHTKALIQALKKEHVGGVALDVYEEEEGVFFEDLSGEVLQDDELARLLTFPNVLITAHQAFLTREALQEIARVTLDNAKRHANGQPFLEGTTL